MQTYISHVDIYAASGFLRDGALLLDGTQIAGVFPEDRPDLAEKADQRIDGRGLTAVPGYIDIHVHGGGGHDIDDGTEESIVGSRDFYGKHGVTAFAPTYMALPLPVIRKGLDSVREVQRQNAPGHPEVLNAHLEGPFINLAYSGCQPKSNILTLNEENVRIYEEYRDVICRTTIAPEAGDNLKWFPRIAALGIQISMGHSQATISQAHEGMEQGATSVTHLYNAMSQTHKEGPYRIGGMVEAGLTLDGLKAEVICDGYHLPNELLRIAWKCKGPDELLIVSDASLCAGMTSGSVVRTPDMVYVVENGIAMNEARTSFASSTTPLDKMVRHLIFDTGLPVEDVVRMASATPARLLGLDGRLGTIAPGKDADINLVDAGFNIVRTFCKGK